MVWFLVWFGIQPVSLKQLAFNRNLNKPVNNISFYVKRKLFAVFFAALFLSGSLFREWFWYPQIDVAETNFIRL